MPSWNELVEEFQGLPDDNQRSVWLRDKQTDALKQISAHRGDTNVVFYASAFLQKPGAPAPTVQITSEDLNGFMSVIFGMDWSKPLTLLLHTPGGVTNAAETIVEYLRSKFTTVEVVGTELTRSPSGGSWSRDHVRALASSGDRLILR